MRTINIIHFVISFCFFDTEGEQDDFQKFVLNNQKLYDEMYLKHASEKPIHYEQIKGYKEGAFLDDYRNVLTLKDMFSAFLTKK